MLVPNTAPPGMDFFEKDQDEFAMYQKCPQGALLPDLNPASYEYQQYHERMNGLLRNPKKVREPVEQYGYYVAIIFDPSGKVIKRSSPALRRYRDKILQDAIPQFSSIVHELHTGGFEGADSFRNPEVRKASFEQRSPRGKEHRPNKRKKRVDDLEISESGSLKDAAFQYHEDEPDQERSGYISFRADSKDEWEKWFNNAFRAVQQVSCRIVAKEWIKTIHPKKQSTHPYNGKNPRTGERGDPSSTKPPYWPEDVIHKEPDHINKEARTKLLVHLLMNTPHREMSTSGELKSDKLITAMVLKESLEQKKLESGNKDLRKKFSIIEQIIAVRTHLEQYEDGGIDQSTILTAPDFSDFSRGSKADEESEEADDIMEVVETEDVQDEEETVVMTDLQAEEPWAVVQNPGSQSHSETTNGVEKQGTRGRKNIVTRQQSRSANDPVARRQSHFLPTRQHGDASFHPPLILPDWDNFQEPHTMLRNEQMAQLGHQDPSIPTSFDGQRWHSQMQGGLEMTSEFADRCTISSTPMSNNGFQQPGMNSHFHPNQQRQCHGSILLHLRQGAEHRIHMHDPRSMQMQESTHFGEFMPHQSPQEGMMHGGYFQM